MKRAFTLIELLVVIAIIALLSTIVLTSLNASRAKARDARRVSDLREVQKALEVYANDHGGEYPPTNGASFYGMCGGFGSQTPVPGLSPQYISQIPSDPEMNTSANTCCYIYASNKQDYKMMDFNCPTANTSNPALASLKDPHWASAWSVYTTGAAGW